MQIRLSESMDAVDIMVHKVIYFPVLHALYLYILLHDSSVSNQENTYTFNSTSLASIVIYIRYYPFKNFKLCGWSSSVLMHSESNKSVLFHDCYFCFKIQFPQITTEGCIKDWN